MKAALFYEVKKPLRIEEIALPTTGQNDVLVRVKARGICYSDLHAFDGNIPFGQIPIIPGHEGAGIVESIGSAVQNVNVGDHVGLRFVMSCGDCHPCYVGRDNLCTRVKFLGFDFNGTYAEYTSISSKHVFQLPDSIPFDEGSIIGCAVVTPLHAMNIAEVKPGSSIAIFGLGGVGIHAVQMGRIFGAAELFAIDIAESKLSLSRSLGATLAIDSSHTDPVAKIREHTGGMGVDYAFDFIGLPTTQTQALKSVKRGGTLTIVGIPRQTLNLDLSYLLVNEIQLRTSFDHTRAEIDTVINLVKAGKLDLSKSITHRFPLERINEGIEVLARKIGDPVRVVVL